MNPFVLSRTVVSLAALLSVAQDDLTMLTTVTAGLTLAFAVIRGAKPCARQIGATLLMVLPLFLVHGVVNPTFTQSTSFYGIPWRVDGASYAALISFRMALLFVAVGIWGGLPRSVTLALLANSRIPTSAGLALMQSLLMSRVIARRVASIRLAQKSRGALGEGRLVRKAAGAVAMVVPLIATTIIDAHERGHALTRMGVGATRFLPPHSLPRPDLADAALALAVVVSVVAIIEGGFVRAHY